MEVLSRVTALSASSEEETEQGEATPGQSSGPQTKPVQKKPNPPHLEKATAKNPKIKKRPSCSSAPKAKRENKGPEPSATPDPEEKNRYVLKPYSTTKACGVKCGKKQVLQATPSNF